MYVHNFNRKEVFQQGYGGSVQEIVEASSFWHDNGEMEATCAAIDNSSIQCPPGIILHHKGIIMDELYCVDPQWLCAVMANVITVQEKNPFQKNGTQAVIIWFVQNYILNHQREIFNSYPEHIMFAFSNI